MFPSKKKHSPRHLNISGAYDMIETWYDMVC